jgi:hypothetical protein
MNWRIAGAAFTLLVAVLLLFPPVLSEYQVLDMSTGEVGSVRLLIWTSLWQGGGSDRLMLMPLSASIIAAVLIAGALGLWGHRRKISLPVSLISGVTLLCIAAAMVPTHHMVVDMSKTIGLGSSGLPAFRDELGLVPIWQLGRGQNWKYFLLECSIIIVFSFAAGLLFGNSRHRTEDNPMPGEAAKTGPVA